MALTILAVLLLVPLLILLNAFFVAAEFALVAVRRTKVETMVDQGVAGAQAVDKATRQLDRSIAATQLGITIASIVLGCEDANPRPLSPLIPSSGLIGCFSADEKMVLAMAWEPYQELFQGVARCLHSDFRLGGLEPGAVRKIKGRIYIVTNDIPALVKRFQADFPEHTP